MSRADSLLTSVVASRRSSETSIRRCMGGSLGWRSDVDPPCHTSVLKQQRVAPPRWRGVLMSSRQVADTAQNDARVAGSSRQRGSLCRSCGVGICWPGRCYTCATGRPRRILRAEERLTGTYERAELSVRTPTGERPHLELVTGVFA